MGDPDIVVLKSKLRCGWRTKAASWLLRLLPPSLLLRKVMSPDTFTEATSAADN